MTSKSKSTIGPRSRSKDNGKTTTGRAGKGATPSRVPSPGITTDDGIEIVGASANNLADLDVSIPMNAMTAIIGVSGSGKSSLIADTLATEGNARMKRFLGIGQDHLGHGDAAAFIGPLPPCVHFAQGGFRASVRTTVATCSGLMTAVRRLFLALGQAHTATDAPVPAPSGGSYAAWLRRHYSGEVVVWAVPQRGVANDGTRCARRLREMGFASATVYSDRGDGRSKGREVALARFKPLSTALRHVIEVEVGRARVDEHALESLLERAFDAGRGTVMVELCDAKEDELGDFRGPDGVFLDSDAHHLHPDDPRPYSPVSRALLSFNMPENPRSGACIACHGIGRAQTVQEAALVSAPERPMHSGAISLWTEKNYKHVNIQHETIEGLRGMDGFDPDVPWRELPAEARALVLHGAGDRLVCDIDRRSKRRLSKPRRYDGFVPAIMKRFVRSEKGQQRLGHLVCEGSCPACEGTRWSYHARALKVGSLSLDRILSMPFGELAAPSDPANRDSPLASAVPRDLRGELARIHDHCQAFVALGLGHLSGDRGMLDVSEGESRRVRLAGLVNSRARGLALLLDEPARGLHEHDIATLVSSLQSLARDNAVVVNEHRFSVVRGADHVIELGPGAGRDGGTIVRQGRPETLRLPGGALDRTALGPSKTRVQIRGVNIHNIADASCEIPLGRLVCITGVSGSGKSNFIRGALLPALAAELGDKVELDGFATRQGSWRAITGAGRIEQVLALDQGRPASNRRSTVATFLGVAKELRVTFARSPVARSLGLAAKDFGRNAGRGRCAQCQGLGQSRDRDLWIPCIACGGSGFGEDALAVTLDGHTIAEFLAIPLGDLAERDRVADKVAEAARLLVDLDMGYVTLGRRIDELSGGEVQRLRIARCLAGARSMGIFLVLDEPSAGLHPGDVARLLAVLDRIVAGGNTVVLIEHQLGLIGACDWIIDFGPAGGPGGGQIVGQGTPRDIAELNTATGRALAGEHGKPARTSRSRRRPGRDEPDFVDDPSDGSDRLAQAKHARRRLRILLGHDVKAGGSPARAARSSGGSSDDDAPRVHAREPLAGLGVVWSEHEPEQVQRRPHEVADLDLELARLFLGGLDDELAMTRDGAVSADELAAAWCRVPEGRLVIAPLLHEVQTWGIEVPRSALARAAERCRAMGLDQLWHGLEPVKDLRDPTLDVRQIRAGGARLAVSAADRTPDARRRAIIEARTLGAGHVEMRDPDGELIAHTASTRFTRQSLEQGVVVPPVLTPSGLSRFHPHGRCPACRGDGEVPAVAEDLVLARRALAISDDGLYKPQAHQVLRGVLRNEMRPFFRRLEKEGLWPGARPFRDLEPRHQDHVLHGYWYRPGPGSFLKKPGANAQEVSSWLRWDGLHRAVIEESRRSANERWTTAVASSTRGVRCIECDGTGLARHARGVVRDGRSLHDWIRHGTVGELHRALRAWSCRDERERRTRDRVRDCLKPLAREAGDATLLAPLIDSLGDSTAVRRIYHHVMHTSTRLDLL